MATWSIAALRTILATETDADSPGSEELLSQMRENWEALTMLAFDTGITTTSTSIAETIWTDTGSPFANVEVGMTLLITSGTAIGNTYTIDATNGTTTVTCTGDTLVTDGVIVTDTAKVMYDLKVNTDGHDHDGVNSAEVVLADGQVVYAKLGLANDLVAGDIAADAVTQSELKVATGTATQVGAGSGNQVMTGGLWCHYPQVKTDSGGDGDAQIADSFTNTAYATYIWLSQATGGKDTDAQWYYHNASGDLFWIFIMRDKVTKEWRAFTTAPDHPCWGNGGDPEALPHPFGDYDENIHEIIVINPDVAWVKMYQKQLPDILKTDFELDETTELDYPTEKVVVAMNGKEHVKKNIAKPDYVKCYKLKPKVK